MRDFYTGLLFDCPIKKCNTTCPFENIRAVQNTTQRFEIWEELSDTDICEMIKQHKACYKLYAEIYMIRH
jgi:hypothetical protein